MADYHVIGDGTIMPRTGIWVDPASRRWGIIQPRSEKALRLQAIYDEQLDDRAQRLLSGSS